MFFSKFSFFSFIGSWKEARLLEERAAADSESELNTEPDRSKGRKRNPVDRFSPSTTPSKSGRRTAPRSSPMKKKTRASFRLDDSNDEENSTSISQIVQKLNPFEEESELAVPLVDTEDLFGGMHFFMVEIMIYLLINFSFLVPFSETLNTTKGDQRFVGQKYPKGGNTGSHSHGPAEATGSNKNRRLPESRVDKSTNNRGTGGKVGSVSHGSEENFDGHNHGVGGKVSSFSRGAGGKVGSFNLGEGGKVSSFNRGPGAKVNSSSRGSKENDGNSHNHDSDDYTGYYQIFFIFSFSPTHLLISLFYRIYFTELSFS